MAAASAPVTLSGGIPALSSTYPPPGPACAHSGSPACSSASMSRLTVRVDTSSRRASQALVRPERPAARSSSAMA
jgi:hypothetical protein